MKNLQQSFSVIGNDMTPLANMSVLMEVVFATLENWFCGLELKTSSRKMKWSSKNCILEKEEHMLC